MSDSTGSVGAGWFHAEGDPAGTERYWNGSEWQGEPRPVAATPPAAVPPPATGGYVPPAFNTPPAVTPRKSSNTVKWLVGIFLVLVLGIGGCTFAVWRAVSGPIDVGNDFLNAVQAEDYDGAWALADASCFEGGGPGLLAQTFEGSVIEAYELNSASVNTTNGTSTGTTSGTVTLSGGDVRAVEIFTSKPGDDWRVCGFDIEGPGGS